MEAVIFVSHFSTDFACCEIFLAVLLIMPFHHQLCISILRISLSIKAIFPSLGLNQKDWKIQLITCINWLIDYPFLVNLSFLFLVKLDELVNRYPYFLVSSLLSQMPYPTPEAMFQLPHSTSREHCRAIVVLS